MPDLTLCTNEDCNINYMCYRFKAKPSEYVQSYIRFEPQDDHCEFFIQIIDETYYLTKAADLL
jgi:hypothetical protein